MTVAGKIFQQPRQAMKVPATPISGGMARWAGGWTGLVSGRSDFFTPFRAAGWAAGPALIFFLTRATVCAVGSQLLHDLRATMIQGLSLVASATMIKGRKE
jgi:hypothetical protein